MSTGKTTEAKGALAQIKKYFADFRVLKETRREYWGTQLLNFLDCTAYFAMFNMATVILSDDFGFSDPQAGKIFALFTALVTLSLFVSGSISDWLGIKKSFYVAFVGLIVSRIGVVFAAMGMQPGLTRNVIVIGSMILMGPFAAMVQTVQQAATKRFTSENSRSSGFSLWYVFMNAGAVAAGFLIDFMYKTLGLPRFHLITLGIFTGVICLLVTMLMIKREEQLHGEGEKAPDAENDQDNKKTPWQNLKEVVKSATFWRFTALVTVLLGVRAIYLYLGIIYPKFWLRMIGPQADVGWLQTINPILITIGLVLLIPILGKFDLYKLLITGASISALSVFITAIPVPVGVDVGHFTYQTTVAFMLVLTVGELMWSPRLQEYTAAIAPKGQEGIYLGLSLLPYFFAKLLASSASGYMLERWCPAFPDGEPILGERIAAGQIAFRDSPYMMFIILGGIAVAGTLIAIVFKGWFTKGMKKAEDEAAAAK